MKVALGCRNFSLSSARGDESQIGPPALTSPELPTSQELIPFHASLPNSHFSPERKSLSCSKTFSTHFSICTAGCVMRRRRLRFRLSAECITAVHLLWGPERLTPPLISCFILLLMDTVDGAEMLLQPRLSQAVICLVSHTAAAVCVGVCAWIQIQNKSDVTSN